MNIVSLNTITSDISKYTSIAQQGGIFVYPTDSIYGVGSIVTPQNIEKINNIKQRKSGKHYSIIAPSFDRIQQHCIVDNTIQHQRHEREKKYGPITVLCPIDPTSNFPFHLVSSNDMVGVRHLSHHPRQDFVHTLGHAFITTSINISGEQPITNIQQITDEQASYIDYIIDDGILLGGSSTLIHYRRKEKIPH